MQSINDGENEANNSLQDNRMLIAKGSIRRIIDLAKACCSCDRNHAGFVRGAVHAKGHGARL